ncbi:MAG: Holliday junction branch migration protein RuvA [Alphaproteobacteria bacterium]|nr:Holliday junction branch migration protein RuvA [Alphaproteobacteria bacterium]
MIAKLTGTVDSSGNDWIVLDVQGVGYLVTVSGRTLDQCRGRDKVALNIETRLSDEKIQLYGFSTSTERDLFRLLQTVQGVGARLALAIIGTFDEASLGQAIISEDLTMLTQAPGVGKKLATRLISELRDRFSGFAPPDSSRATLPASGLNPSPQPATGAGKSDSADAISALVNLGYGRSLAFGAVAEVEKSLLRSGAPRTTANLIRLALAHLNRTNPSDSGAL